jgi:hypothetical protein
MTNAKWITRSIGCAKDSPDLRLISHVALDYVHLAGIAGLQRGTVEASYRMSLRCEPRN